MKQTQDNFNLCYVHSYQEKEHHWFESNGFAGIQSLYRPVLKHTVLIRTLLDKYKCSHFGAFYPCPKQSAFHSYQVLWFVTNLTRPQQQAIFLPQNSGERFLDCTKTICSQGRQSVNYKCNSKKRSLGHKSFTFKN